MWCRKLALLSLGALVLAFWPSMARAEDGMDSTFDAEYDSEGADDGDGTEGSEVDATIDASIERAPAYEETYEENFRERYYRITKDFIRPQRLGLGRVGQVPWWPRGTMRVGPLRVSPHLSASVGYTTNVNLEDDEDDRPRFDNVDESFFASTSVGALADGQFLKDKVRIRGAVEWEYTNYFNEDGRNDWQLTAGVSGRYEFDIGIWIELGVVYSRLSDPIDYQWVPTRARRDDMDYNLEVGFDRLFQRSFGRRWKFEIGFDVMTSRAVDTDFSLIDRTTYSARARVAYNALREVDVYVQYRYQITQVDSHSLNDSDSHQIEVGLDGAYNLTKSGRLQGIVFVGVRQTGWDPEDFYEVDGDDFFTEDNDPKTSIEAGLLIRYLMGTRTTIELSYVHTIAYQLRGNSQDVDRIDLSAMQLVMRDLIARIGLYAEWNQPSHGIDDVYRYGVGAGLRYAINDFMDADLSYDFRLRIDTDINGVDYIEHMARLGLTFYLR